MIIKILWFLNALSCEWDQTFLVSKITQISKIINEWTFLKNFLPNFYNFQEVLNFDFIVLHYTDIIEKYTNINLIESTICEYQKDKETFKKQLFYIIKNLEIMKSNLQASTNILLILQKIEFKFLSFLYKKINMILTLDYNNILLNVLTDDVSVIESLIQSIIHFKKYIIKKQRLGLNINTNLTLSINKTLKIFNNKKNNLINRLKSNCVLNNASKEYFNNIIIDKNLKKFCWRQQPVLTIRDNQVLIKNNFNIIKKIFQENIDLESTNIVLKVKDNLYKVVNAIFIISQINFLELEIECFLNIFEYYNFLRDIIFLKQYTLEKIFNLEQNYIKKLKSVYSKFFDALSIVVTQKHLLCKLIYDFSKNSFFNVCRDPRFLNQRMKFSILRNFVSLECFFDNLIDSGMSESYCIQQHNKMIYTRNKIFIHFAEYNSLNHETFINNFDIFRIQCILLFRLSSLYLYEKNSYKKKYHIIFYRFISDLIKKFQVFICNKKLLNSKVSKKYLLVNIIIKKLEEIRNFLENAVKIKVINKFKQVIYEVFLSELNFQIQMFEVCHKN
ncbi:hypothetical protein NUSPORA_00904 [Nucleospora cyclopteri]